jgi:hypothetical protein
VLIEAYAELKGKTGVPVIVGIVDSGADVSNTKI